ncbi:tyrosine-protein phosphatase [Pseudomonas sp.]|uniref:tyrosine-protein phosphatase n=1 Tax=Pseudomonas sp. TaxID=306 RepID=UPI0028AFE666|nr:tyrosine-protein phosphatase [Pseudomonas sp.]
MTLDTPRLPSMDNFRDIAGSHLAYCTPTSVLRSNVFYRSNVVNPSPADKATLERLGVQAIFDLRADQEIAAEPDTHLDGSQYQQFNVLGHRFEAFDPSSFKPRSAEEVSELMREVNRDFVRSAPVRSVLGELLTAMAQTPGPVLFHCSAGKDRTGWVTALLQSIAGADETVLMNDYLATNVYTAARIKATLAAMPEDKGAIYAPALTVDASYLNAALEQVRQQFGDMPEYLRTGLHLSSRTLNDLRSKLLV